MSREKMLNRERIIPAIKKFCSETYKQYTVSNFIHKGDYRHRVDIEADGASFFVDFHFRGNGSTSIDISSGLYMDKKKQIKDVILSDSTLVVSK